MKDEELLNLYLEKLRIASLEMMQEKNISIMEALKSSLIFLEGEMSGY